jgi:WD40 repeat protein
MAAVFVSYSRRDKEFVRRLSDALAAQEREAWIDWKDIPLTAEWQQEILTNIEAADTFIFVISPASVASVNCRKEIDHAAGNNKRMVPILYRAVPDEDVPDTLARFQRIDLSEDLQFDSGFAALIKALDTDLAWVQTHTRLLTRAKEWERQGRERSFLLRGRDLGDAEQWRTRSAEHEPKPTPLQIQYVLVSRQAANRQRRITLGAVAVTLVIAAALAAYAIVTQQRKEDALARSLAGRSATVLSDGSDTEMAALLALESVKRRPTDEGAQTLRNALVFLRRTHVFFANGTDASEIAFSPDSKSLVTVSREDDVARVYEVDSGRELVRLRHDAAVRTAVFSPDGRVILTGGNDKTARVWDTASGRELQRFVCDGELTAVAISKEGLSATGSETAAQVWDTQTGRELVPLEHPKRVGAVAFSPSGKWFASGGRDGSVQVWDRVGGSRKTFSKQSVPIRALAFSPADETHLLIAGAEDDASAELRIVDVVNANVLAHGSYRSSFSLRRAFFTSDPNRILVYGEGQASVWDAHLTRLVKADVESSVDRTVLSADGRLLLTFHQGVLRIIGVAKSGKGQEVARVPFPDAINVAELSPDGRLLAVGGEGRSRILEIYPSLESLRLTNLGPVSDVSFSAGCQWAAIASAPSWILDLQRPWEPPRSLESSDADKIALDVNGDRVVTGTQTNLTVWNSRTGGKLASAPLPGGMVPAPLAFSPDSRRVLLTYGHEWLKTFEWMSGKWSEDTRFDHVHAISEDARLLAVRPDDHSIRIVEAATQRQVTSLPFAFAPFVMAFGGGSKLLITVEQGEGVAHICDLDSRKELAQLSDFDRIQSAAISPDGRLAATGGYGDVVRFQLWRKNDDLIRYACDLITRPLTDEEWKQYLPEDRYAGYETCPEFQSRRRR